MRVDNEDLTDRDITLEINNSQLYRDRLFMSLKNADLKMKNLNGQMVKPSDRNSSNADKLAHAVYVTVLGNPVHETVDQKLFTLYMHGSGDMGPNGILFQHVKTQV